MSSKQRSEAQAGQALGVRSEAQAGPALGVRESKTVENAEDNECSAPTWFVPSLLIATGVAISLCQPVKDKWYVSVGNDVDYICVCNKNNEDVKNERVTAKIVQI